MFAAKKWLLTLLVLAAAVFGGAPVNAAALPDLSAGCLAETRVGGYQTFDAVPHPAAASQVLELQRGIVFAWYDPASECSVAAENAATTVERIRHYTSPEALRSIRQSEQLLASRPIENPGVWFTREPFSSRFNPQVGSAGRGAFVEIDAPAGMRAVNLPGESPWGFVPTEGASLNIGNLNPTYIGRGPFGLW